MNPILKVILLSILPVSELRGAIPLGISLNLNPLGVFIASVLANILIIPFIFLFLDYLHNHFRKIRIYERAFDKAVERTRKKIEHRIGTRWEFFFLWLLVAIPLPGTGAYTGSLAAWLFKLQRKKAFMAISLGVLTAGIIVTFLSIGIFSLF